MGNLASAESNFMEKGKSSRTLIVNFNQKFPLLVRKGPLRLNIHCHFSAQRSQTGIKDLILLSLAFLLLLNSKPFPPLHFHLQDYLTLSLIYNILFSPNCKSWLIALLSISMVSSFVIFPSHGLHFSMKYHSHPR